MEWNGDCSSCSLLFQISSSLNTMCVYMLRLVHIGFSRWRADFRTCSFFVLLIYPYKSFGFDFFSNHCRGNISIQAKIYFYIYLA